MKKKKTTSKTRKSRVSYFRSNSQRKGTGKLALLFGSKRVTILAALLLLGSLFGGAAIVQQTRESRAATIERIVLADTNCGRIVNPGSSVNPGNNEILCLNPGTYSTGSINLGASGATVTTTPSRLSQGKARILGKFNVNGDNNRILNLYIDGQGNNSGTILTPNGTDNTIIQGNDITSTAPNKGTSDFNIRQGICLNIGSGGSSLSSVGPKNTIIDRNRIFNCGWGKYDQAIYLSNNQNARVTNNYVYDNPMFALQFYPDSDGAIVENNVFDRNSAGITFSGQSNAQVSQNNIFRNNIVSNSGQNPYGAGHGAASSESSIGHWWGGTVGSGNQANNNCIFNGRYGIYKGTPTGYTISGNITNVDPLYTNPGAKDFTLRAGSPCAGKGPLLTGGSQPAPPPAPAPTPTPTPTTDTTAPSVNITTPVNSADLSGTTTISASASDNVRVSGVQFRVNGNNIGSEDTSAPYSISWNTASVPNSAYAITAVARDTAGNTKISSAISVTVTNRSSVTPPAPSPAPPAPTPSPAPTPDTSAPSISLSSPVNGAKLSGSTTISATASDNVRVTGVKFFVNGSQVGGEDTSSPFSTTWNSANVANGNHTVTAVARDAAGNSKTSQAISVSVTNTVATPSPTPTPSPSPSPPTTGTSQLSVEAENATSCVIRKAFTYYCSQGSWTWSSSGANGGKFIALTNTGDSVTQRFNVDTAGNYRLGYILRSQSYRGDAKVDIHLDGVKIASGVSLSPTSFTYKYIERQLSSGSHTLKVTFVNDKWGNFIPYERGNSTNDRNAYVDQFRLIKL